MINREEYSKACVEVLEILNNMSQNDVQKVPKEIIELLEKDKDREYKFKFDKNKKNISKVSKAILGNFYRDYWANDYERKVIIAKQNSNRMQLEEIKKNRYGSQIIFKGKKRQ